MTKTLKCDVLVVGTGIIGSMAALYLQNAGRDVVLLERGDISRGASSGNAGILAFPEIIPIPAPGIMKKAPRWLFDPLGPLSVPPAYAPKIAPWLWRFWRASAERNFRHGLKSLMEINRLAAIEMAHIAAMPELSPFISKTGTLDIYDSEASLNAAGKDWDEKEKAGFAFQRVDRNKIEELQPGLAPQFRHAVFSADGLQVSDPYDFTRAIFDLVISRGASLRKGEAQRIDAVGESTIVTLENGDKIDADKVVIACGAWSKKLAATLGNIVPLETERGYNTTLPVGAFNLTRQLYFNDHGFVVTPLSTGIRVGGAVELGGLELKPNFRRAEAMLKKAERFLPGLKLEGGRQWMGFRPSMPDCLPVIGTARTTPSVIYAFGHGHLGLTQSAATARLVTQMANGDETSISVDPFRPGRFS
ncbi:UNVERIFIED_ORG: D-amino-acid dehydrogenase [Rhizobium sp. SORGH_AS260]|uniref:NAD(P)/FAD-dependent oxidoreductase n=1 Tax=Agrobacterium sp. SORGH_AS_0440 TaxID=3041757 RepID=UPI0027810CA8|nr:FAD-binding oxidoreductase [Agrobacterium sp. SORGH_AS_0440]MDP9730399.1 D-amino-acid dehydrogenase [Rhizobium sp. SORGH_AS_0285]MDP9753545.1 D-amino-acid dehydrogenase [Rhizobium sp. SORGH_AS_0260]MDR6080520.1 D-amino-acid dehydrogenase [Agrobacterium sp. SORGH_AS_0440]